MALAALLLLLGIFPPATVVRAQTTGTLSLQDRVMMATQIYHVISTFFPGLSQKKFDLDYRRYLATILDSDDRRDFDVKSMALVATLRDGHSWFYDTWLDRTYGQPTGILSYPLRGRWTVVRSALSPIQVGDVITAVDNTPMQEFFSRNRIYVSASSDRDAGLSFFDTPIIFPEKFMVTLEDGRKIPIDRVNDRNSPRPPDKAEGRWLLAKTIAYIKVPTFHGIETQAQALELLRQFHDARTLILDVRGNPGLGDPGPLQRALMVNPYPDWNESASQPGGVLLRNYGHGYPERSMLTITDTVINPPESAYSGRIILLTDRICSSACEDFVMPFKFAKRATLIGETTAGSFSMTRHIDFENGMILNIAAVHHTFPDGSQFEGIGITPDTPVEITPEDLRAGHDLILEKALQLARP